MVSSKTDLVYIKFHRPSTLLSFSLISFMFFLESVLMWSDTDIKKLVMPAEYMNNKLMKYKCLLFRCTLWTVRIRVIVWSL